MENAGPACNSIYASPLPNRMLEPEMVPLSANSWVYGNEISFYDECESIMGHLDGGIPGNSIQAQDRVDHGQQKVGC